MKKENSILIEVNQLHVGMYISLEVGWMAHPFPTGSFKISSEKQLETIRGLGLTHVRYIPEKSDAPKAGEELPSPAQTEAAALAHATRLEEQKKHERSQHAALLAAQERSQIYCEQRFGEAAQQYRSTIDQLHSQPQQAAKECNDLIDGLVAEMLGEGESVIRLLTQSAGDKVGMHPVNVSVLSLLLGKSMGLDASDLSELGMAAFLHDIGKIHLPERARYCENNFSPADYKLYQDHVAESLRVGKTMGLSSNILLAIAEHHEMVDGSGFPSRLRGDKLTPAARILALVNRYDNMCNPIRVSSALTPHEALSLIFSQLKNRFDHLALSSFIRMMGVYPPGSIVQLVDERYASVVAVNSNRPLKPKIMIHEPSIPKSEALIVDMDSNPQIGIRRSIKPATLPDAALAYLAPRQRLYYFFEQVARIDTPEQLA